MAHKAGFVNIIGRPNAGKSTLMNELVGENLSIINPKAQTTRHRILGIINEDEYQIIFSDTPGILDPKYALQSSMMAFVKEALSDADVLLLIIDGSARSLDFFGLEKAITNLTVPLVVALNKIDLLNQESLEAYLENLKTLFPKAEIHAISATEKFGVDGLRNRILHLLPENPPYYDKDALTDKPVRFFVSEIIRERILSNYEKEIPYSVEVEVESYVEEPDIIRISSIIYVERKTQKGILIGKKGEKLKKVGTEARKGIEKFVGKKVFLELYVKIDPDWRKKDNRLKAYGYK